MILSIKDYKRAKLIDLSHNHKLDMGTSWSEEQKGSSERQDQPVYHSESDTISSQKSDINTPVPITRNNNNNSHHLNEPKESKRVLLKLPHNCEAIINDNSDSPIDKSSPEKVYEQLHAGVYLNGRRKVSDFSNNCILAFKKFYIQI